jgi:hypothetical protein
VLNSDVGLVSVGFGAEAVEISSMGVLEGAIWGTRGWDTGDRAGWCILLERGNVCILLSIHVMIHRAL